MSSPLNFNSSTPPGTRNSINWQPDTSHTNVISHAQTVCGSLQTRTTAWVLCWILLRLFSITAGPMNDSAASSESVWLCVCLYRGVGGGGGFTCGVFKVHVQHLLSGAALEMFLSCCLSFLLSWRISSRSLASPSSPPAARDGWRWMDVKRGKGGKETKRNKTTWGEEWETDDVKWCSRSAEVRGTNIERETNGERSETTKVRIGGCGL